jgi:uncharacterized cysteine cluster protein YcgN (CxxCxxCC family)
MGTRSSINFYKDGIVKTIYCHWDGYLSNNGKILLSSYNTIERVEELLSFGDCSSLDDDLTKCEFYGRDRNEKDSGCREYQVGQIENVKKIPIEEAQEYNYLFFDDGWYFTGYLGADDFETWTILTPNMCKD